MRDGFIFYKSFYEAIKNLPPKDKIKLYEGLIEYALLDKEPNFSGISKGMFELMRPQIDANNRRYENGKKGGRPKKEVSEETETQKNERLDKMIEQARRNLNKT